MRPGVLTAVFPAPATPSHSSRYVYTHVPIFSLKTVEINYLTAAGCEKAGVHLDTEAHLQPYQVTSPSELSDKKETVWSQLGVVSRVDEGAPSQQCTSHT